MIKLLPALPALALIAVLGVGCGGGGDATITKAELIKKGDAICEKTDTTQVEEFQSYGKKHEKEFKRLPGDRVERLLIVRIGLPSIRREGEEIEALGAPSGDEKEVEALTAAIENGLKAAEKNPPSVEVPAENPFRKADKLAREYGFTACAEII
jgi:hypothetical protein